MPPRPPRLWTLALVRAAFSIALAYSYTFNIRNVEYYWYPLWNHILLDIIPPDRPDLVVAPQFLLWIDPSIHMDEAEDPEPPAGKDSSSNSHSNTDERDASDLLDEDDGDFEDEPTLSYRTTAASSEASAQLVDFAIAHLIMTPTEPDSPPIHPDRSKPHWVIADREIPVLVEIKRFTSRRHPENFGVWDLERLFFAAKEQLVTGAAHVFAQTDAQEVRVIAAVGPWWTNRTFRRHPDAQPTRLSDEDLQFYLKEGNTGAYLSAWALWIPIGA
ncbi:hypothetical protein CPB85DRAFT_1527129 [Mucidula mucida]|nr:hypothetical protein CPB85DRAFT_1527129 [Mucidula mucida]